MNEDDQDLLERIEGLLANAWDDDEHETLVEARDRIQDLTAENERLRGLLSRTIVMAETYAEGTGTQFNEAMAEARAALEEKK